MFIFLEKAIVGMALLRILSGSIEVIMAFFILKSSTIEKALILNTSLAFVGPLVLIATTTIGLFGMAEKVSLVKMLWIFGGVACILYGIKSQ
ncbi:YqhV family protein [Pseudoneobacillus sp. C159]